jgi:ParB/RepB/Spo0J family partition protein
MGLIQPIVLRNGTTLVAGERRLTAFKNLGRSKIPAIAIESLDDRTAYILELEENLRRADISWQERSKAFKAIHDSFLVDDPEWTQVKTAARLGVSEATVTMYISLAEEMVNDPNLRTIPKATTAYETIKRRVDRQLDDVLVSMPLAVRNVVIPPQLDKSNLMARAPVVPEAPKHMAAGSSLINADFIEWAANYKGPRFNLIHCDFPYGAAAGKKGSQIHAGGSHRSYEDSDDIFWELMDALFVPNIIAQSAHILLWYQTSEFRRVMGYLEGLLLDLRVLDVPLIWHKSDNSSPSR